MAWLEAAYGDGLHDAALSRIRAAKPHLGDIQLRYATLLGRLGPALDGPGALDGRGRLVFHPRRHPRAIRGRSAGHGADRTGRPRRHIARHRTPGDPARRRRLFAPCPAGCHLSNLYERGRSLGLGVKVSAQSWQGLGRDDDERYRISRHR